jgi:predicted phage terminase large subunit-like protein
MNLVRIERDLGLRGTPLDFAEMAWPLLEKGRPFSRGWHLEHMQDHLMAVTAGEIPRLILEVPPGHMKSLLTSVIWPVWEWLRDPSLKGAFISYSDKLINRDANRVADLLGSKWFAERWGDVVAPARKQAAVTDYLLASGGQRFSTTINGQITGFHFDRGVIDDPMKAADAYSPVVKAGVRETWDTTFSTRFRFGRVVVIAQRLAEDDLPGHLQSKGDRWTVVKLPARFISSLRYATKWGVDPRAEEGAILWPERYTDDMLHEMEAELGPAGWQSQAQQNPAANGARLFEKAWLEHEYEHLPPEAYTEGEWVDSWDFTFKDTPTADYVAGLRGVRVGALIYLVKMIRDRMDFPTSLAAIEGLAQQEPHPSTILVEDKANGPAIISMTQDRIPGITPVEPKGGKTARAHAVTGRFKAGQVLTPKGAPWVAKWRHELLQFPGGEKGENDDQVDVTTQLVSHFQGQLSRYRSALAATTDDDMRSLAAELQGAFGR